MTSTPHLDCVWVYLSLASILSRLAQRVSILAVAEFYGARFKYSFMIFKDDQSTFIFNTVFAGSLVYENKVLSGNLSKLSQADIS